MEQTRTKTLGCTDPIKFIKLTEFSFFQKRIIYIEGNFIIVSVKKYCVLVQIPRNIFVRQLRWSRYFSLNPLSPVMSHFTAGELHWWSRLPVGAVNEVWQYRKFSVTLFLCCRWKQRISGVCLFVCLFVCVCVCVCVWKLKVSGRLIT